MSTVGLSPGSRTRGVEGQSQFLEGMAASLRIAIESGPIPPITPAIPYPNIGLAYAIQETNTRHWLAQGRRIVGRKVGLTSQGEPGPIVAMPEPCYGILFADMQMMRDDALSLQGLTQPRLEPALAFHVGADILARPDNFDAFWETIAGVSPALEILDSRIADWRVGPMDVAADNASCARFVLGAMVRPAKPGRVRLQANNVLLAVTPADLFGEASVRAYWMARKAPLTGRLLLAGDIILVGAIGPRQIPQPGSYYALSIGGIGEVSLTISGCAPPAGKAS
jgi:2-keto-4-pentenoate hydratase